jgi:hypothetical protein
MDGLNTNPELKFQNSLMKDEHILWAGQPDPNVLFSSSDVFLIPFSILWGGFAIFWEAMVLWALIRSEFSPIVIVFPLFGIPFVLIGLYFMFGRFFFKKRNKRSTYYAVTNKRILILNDRKNTLQELNIDSIPGINSTVKSNGTGTITFNSASLPHPPHGQILEWTSGAVHLFRMPFTTLERPVK